jgi:hypothetical protein
MIDYTFLETPSPLEIARLTELYRQAGWWTDDGENPVLVAGIVAGSHCFLVARQADHIVAMGRAISDRVSDAYIPGRHRGSGIPGARHRLPDGGDAGGPSGNRRHRLDRTDCRKEDGPILSTPGVFPHGRFCAHAQNMMINFKPLKPSDHAVYRHYFENQRYSPVRLLAALHHRLEQRRSTSPSVPNSRVPLSLPPNSRREKQPAPAAAHFAGKRILRPMNWPCGQSGRPHPVLVCSRGVYRAFRGRCRPATFRGEVPFRL